MSGWRRALRLLIGVVLAVTIYFTMPIDVSSENTGTRFAISMLMITVLTVGTIWEVVRHIERPELRVDGLVFAIVLGILAFALAYYRVETVDPGQFAELETRLDALYFAVSTLLTVGFGDVHAVGQTARGLVLVAMLFNVLVVTTAVTTLSSAVRRRATERVLEKEQARQAGAADHSPRRSRRTHRNPR